MALESLVEMAAHVSCYGEGGVMGCEGQSQCLMEGNMGGGKRMLCGLNHSRWMYWIPGHHCEVLLMWM